MVTTKRIAELAGVSRATVDRALHDKEGINKATKEQILKIARELHYVPNLAARTLVKQGAGTKIGCMLMEEKNPFIEDVLCGIRKKNQEYTQYGVELLVRHIPFEAETTIRTIDELMKEKIDGLIIQPIQKKEVVEKLSSLSIPIVMTNTSLPGFKPLCYIGSDFRQGGSMAANLIDIATNGQCKIGIVNGFASAQSHRDRVEGFKEYIARRSGMSVTYEIECQDSELIASRLTALMLHDHPEINALFIVAGGVYGTCMAVNTTGRDDIRIVSFDCIETTKEMVRKGLIAATICQAPVRQGELSLEVLYDYLVRGQKPESDEVLLDLQIRIASNIDM